MFNNIIYFIVVLLIFNISYSDSPPEDFLFSTLIPLFLSWAFFAIYSGKIFGSLLKRLRERGGDDGVLTDQYQRITVRLSVLSIILFALAVYFFNLKQWLNLIPGFGSFSVLQGVLALALFSFICVRSGILAIPFTRQFSGWLSQDDRSSGLTSDSIFPSCFRG